MLDAWKSLVAAARGAQRRAHAPYSRFRVGAALRDADGAVFLGANLENAAYPLGVCAERVALAQWRADRAVPIAAIVIFTQTATATPPCGLCRDALLRFAPGAEICLATPAGRSGPWKAAEWLPSAPENVP
jgi:cytidine deaminase